MRLHLAVPLEDERNDVDHVADELHLGPLVALDDVLGDQRVEPELAGGRMDEVRVRVRQVDPGAAALGGDEAGEAAHVLGDLEPCPSARSGSGSRRCLPSARSYAAPGRACMT